MKSRAKHVRRLSRAGIQEQASQRCPGSAPGQVQPGREVCRWRRTSEALHHPSQAHARAPRFKRRNNRQSIRICGKEFRTTDQGVRFPKIGELRLRWSRSLPAAPGSVTIIKDCAGRYVASFVVEVEREQLPPNSFAVGVDLGLASLAVTSDGMKITPPTFLRAALQRIRRLQWSLSRKVKGANNRTKARFRLAKAHATVADQRLDPPGVQSQDLRTNCSGCLPTGANLPDLLRVWLPHRQTAAVGTAVALPRLLDGARP